MQTLIGLLLIASFLQAVVSFRSLDRVNYGMTSILAKKPYRGRGYGGSKYPPRDPKALLALQTFVRTVGKKAAVEEHVEDPDPERDALIEKVKANVKPGSVIVIKYGGHAMENEELQHLFIDDVADLFTKANILPIIVHGGGPQIAKMLKELKVESQFVDGLRVTDAATLDVAEMVLFKINKELSFALSEKRGVKGAVGLSGLDGQLIKAKQISEALGFVGEPTSINAEYLQKFLDSQVIPIISPIGVDENKLGIRAKRLPTLNINADTAAGAVAQAMKADRFLLLTDIVGVLDKEKNLIERIPIASVPGLREDGTISGGMIPKLQTAVDAIEAGVGAVSIMDGRERHSVLRALSGEPFGTVVCN